MTASGLVESAPIIDPALPAALQRVGDAQLHPPDAFDLDLDRLAAPDLA